MSTPSELREKRTPFAVSVVVGRLTDVLRSHSSSLFWSAAIGAALAITVALARSEAVTVHHIAALVVTLAVIVFGVAGFVAFARGRSGASCSLSELQRDTLNRVSLLSIAPVCLAMATPIESRNCWVVLCAAALSGAVAAHWAYQWASERPGSSGRAARLSAAAVLVGITIGYTAITIHLAIQNHLAMNTGRSDLGYYLSIFRKSSEGQPLGCSLCGGDSHLTGHFDPILVALSPLFLIYPWAETLLVLQAVWLASGSVPVYLLARERIGHRGAALAFAAAYLLYPALHGVNLFDFHSIALCIPPLVWLLYFIETRRFRAAYLIFALALLVREDVSLATALTGVACIFSKVKERIRVGWILVVASLAYFIVAKVFFMGHGDPLNASQGHGGYAHFYAELIPAGHSTAALVATLIADPVFSLTRILTEGKVVYVAQLLVPLLGLPLFARGRIQLAYGFAVTLLATERLYSVHAQYSSTLIPFMFGLAIAAIGRLRGLPADTGISGERLARAASFGVLVSSLLCSWKFGALVPNDSFIAGFRPLVRRASAESVAFDQWMRNVARSFPRGSGVAANTRILPHLGPVSNIYMIEDRRRADYVIANLKNPEVAREVLRDEAAGLLVPIEQNAPYRVYRTKYPKIAKPGVEEH